MGWPKVATAKNSPSSCEYCRRWLAENRPPAPSFRMPINPIEVASEEQRKYLCAWQKKCHAAGLVGSDCPTEYGGHGHKGFQTIASQEMARANVPFMINVIGLGMAAPTILVHHTEAQKRRYLPPLLSSDEIWCQGFSEPGAGSDLANVQSTAVRQGDNWIINGHKVWTSLAHFASWMIMITRHSRDHKYNGLTYFIVPIAGAKGVTVRRSAKPNVSCSAARAIAVPQSLGSALREKRSCAVRWVSTATPFAKPRRPRRRAPRPPQ